MECRKYEEEEIKFIRDNYGYIPIKEIADELNRSYSSVSVKISKLGLSNIKHKIYSTNVDMNFFNNWSAELAYVIGYFLADGYLFDYDKWKYYGVYFSSKDFDILYKMSVVCGYRNKISKAINKKRNTWIYEMKFSGKYIWNFFDDLGFNNNKSHTAKIPKQIPKKFMSHCVRGIFDGDGGIFLKSNFYPFVAIVGTKDVINSIEKYCNGGNVKNKDCSPCYIWYYGKRAIDFLNWIYEDSTIHMDRKYNKYLNVFKWSI